MEKIAKAYNDAHIIYKGDSEIFTTMLKESLIKLENNSMSDYQYGFLQAGLDILEQEGGVTNDQNQKIRLKSYGLNATALTDLNEFLDYKPDDQTNLSVPNFETVNREILAKEFAGGDKVNSLKSDKEQNDTKGLGL